MLAEVSLASKMAKCVRCVHSHTVTEAFDRDSFFEHPLSDQCPAVKMAPELLGEETTSD